ncbi:MAG: hypothetical protein R6T85_02755 [Egibacteraceae bacterium]
MGPYDVLNSGVAARLGVTFGLASVLVSTLFVAFGWRLGAPVGPGTLVAMLGIGPSVDAWGLLLPESVDGLAAQGAMLAVGIVAIALGLSLVIAADLGAGPMEVVMLGLAGRGVPLRWVRTGLEVTVFATGWALGGQVGVGTVVVALAIGHLIAAFVPPDVSAGAVARAGS